MRLYHASKPLSHVGEARVSIQAFEVGNTTQIPQRKTKSCHSLCAKRTFVHEERQGEGRIYPVIDTQIVEHLSFACRW